MRFTLYSFAGVLLVSTFLNCVKSNKLPEPAKVGAAATPTDIAPIKAPFNMPQLQRPSFPDKEYSITDFGATEGGTSKVTQAIQQAIDQASNNGGGKVIVPAGKWLSGRIHLKSNVNLYISKDAELHFSGEMEDYRPPVFCRIESLELYSLGALIYAHKQENIGITGKGTLYGPESGPVREIVLHTVSDSIVSWQTPVKERVYDGIAHKIYFRPYFISPVDCRNVLIEGLTLKNGPMWNVVPVYCENVIVRGIRVESVDVGNGDGINIESSRNVLVEYCTVNTGDDCYCMKAGRNQDGVRVNKPVENVVLRYCSSEGGHGGITFGSETAGKMRNVYVHDCVFENNNIGIRFKTRRPRAGGGENLTIENIRLNVRKNAMEWDMLGLSIWVGNLANRLPAPPVTPLTPFYRNITIRNVAGQAERHVLKMEGLPESPVKNVSIENVNITAKQGISMTDGSDISFKNSKLFFTEEPVMSLTDCWNLKFENVKVNTPLQANIILNGKNCENISLDNVQFSDGQKSKLTARDGADVKAVIIE